MFQKTIFLILSAFFISINLQAEEVKDFLPFLKKKLPGAEITKIDATDHFKQEFEILITQQLDHNNPKAGTFQQRIFLGHVGKKAPVLFVTEGYNARDRTYELSKILNSNQIIVEYRFFGKSVPTDMEYEYLNNAQAMEDLHHIHNLFSKVYCSKEWVSTGISKGGTTTLYYKAAYPNDVKVAVPYVAPLPYVQSDTRCDDHILSIGTDECRSKLDQFQRDALGMREQIIAKLDSMATEEEMEFSIGTDKAFEFCVLEYTFSFWQWGHDCEKVPANPDANTAFEYLNEIVGFDFYTDETTEFFGPAFYQFMKENGYYSFIHEHVKDSLKALTVFDNRIFAPKGEDLSFDPSYNEKVRSTLNKDGNRIIHIQGGLDPWGACGYLPTPDQDALLMVKEGGSHFTRIANFSAEDQALIYKKLGEWLKVKITPLPKEKSKS